MRHRHDDRHARPTRADVLAPVARRVGWAALYLLFLTCLTVGAAEIFLRLYWTDYRQYYIWPPGLQAVFHPSEEATPGVSGPGRFTINSLGIRADEVPPNVERIVLVLGGSTAIELYLDQDETWTALLQKRLNDTPGTPKTWVGNLGKSSMASRHNILHMEHAFPSLPKPNLIVDLIGANDLQLALKSSYLRDMTDEQHLSWAFSYVPGRGSSAWNPEQINTLWERTALSRLFARLSEVREKLRTGPVQSYNADGFISWRKCRQEAVELVGTLPDIEPALTTFRRNLQEIVDRATKIGAPIVFVTQPTLWSPDIAPAESSLLLTGGIGPNNEWCERKRYYSPAVLAEGLERFNTVTLSVCRDRGLVCVDLANELPKQALYFYDDMHFSEAGARKIAEILSETITRAGLLKKRPIPAQF